MKMKLKKYIHEHLHIYLFVTVLFLMGVGFGVFFVRVLSWEQKQEVTRYFHHFLMEIKEHSYHNAFLVFQDVFWMHMKWLLLIWLFGLSIIGFPLILFLDFVKGVFIGFTISYIMYDMSWKGILFTLVSIAPHNLLILPTLLFCSVAGINFSFKMLKHQIIYRKCCFTTSFLRFSSIVLIMGIFMLGASFLESYIVPKMLKWFIPHIEVKQELPNATNCLTLL